MNIILFRRTLNSNHPLIGWLQDKDNKMKYTLTGPNNCKISIPVSELEFGAENADGGAHADDDHKRGSSTQKRLWKRGCNFVSMQGEEH